MPKVQCNDQVWRQFIGRTCQDCMKRIDGDFKAHTCDRLESFPMTHVSTRRAGDIVHKQPLEDMPIESVKMILKGKKYQNYGKKV